MLTEKVYSTIIKYNMIEKGDKVLVGFSGGADSLFLMLSLTEIKKYIDFDIYAAHLNHGIRGIEAISDENFVTDFCKNNNIPFFCKTVNIPEISRENKISEETAGRNERYKFFNEICQKHSINKIAVAHNMNDSVETTVYNMIRGASLNGLCGIKPVNDNIIRPIIEVSRDEIEKHLEQIGECYCTDSTNLTDLYTRNKIRNVILKNMREINPSVIQTIYSNSLNLRNDDEFINDYVKKLNCISDVDNTISINKKVFNNQHISVKFRIIRRAFEMLKGNCEGISSSHLEIISKADSSGKIYDMPGGIKVTVSFDKIVFMCEMNKHQGFEYNYTIGEKIEYMPGIYLSSTYCDSYLPGENDCLYIDADKLKTKNLILRSRRDGDKFIPYGMKESKKLKKYFTEQKIPSYKRDEIPLITDSENIVCIVPYRISDLYKVNETTKNIVKFEITKEK